MSVVATGFAGALVGCLVVLMPRYAWGGSQETALWIEPSAVGLVGRSARQQLAVTQTLDDGSVRDVTSRCRFTVEPAGIADVTAGGVVLPRRDGAAVVRVAFGAHTASLSLSVERAEWDRAICFRTDVVPLLSKAGCNMGACHGNLNGKGSFRLSLRGDDPAFDHQSLTHDGSGRRLSRMLPERSLIVMKPTGTIPHEGGRRFERNSIEALTLLRWIAAGAGDDRASAPRVSALRLFPAERISSPGTLEQQLVVTAEFDDGTTRDVTRQASYDVNDPTRVEVSADGFVRARASCETAVSVRYMNGRATSRLAFLPDRAAFTWRGLPSRGVIDDLIFAKLKSLRINPSPPCSDLVFVRRAYLDAIGRLPDPAEIRAFASAAAADKRDKLIDCLVDRPEFADFWALKWADLLRNEEKTMGEKGAWIFQRWLRDQIAGDVPLDEMVRKIVGGLGSTWRNPPSSFYRTNRDPMTAAETVSQVFLGIRLQCARCHNHPFDVWTQDDYFGMAASFANIARKQPSNNRKDKLDSHEINGDEVIYLAGQAGIVQPRTGQTLKPKFLAEATTSRAAHGETDNALLRLAGWLTRGNPQFSRNMANRAWFHIFGRGIVDPVDDFRDSNPPANPALLDALAAHFDAGQKRLKPFVAWIMKSQAYQLSAAPDETNADDVANFSHALVRLLPAEVLLDAVSQVLDVPEPFPKAPAALRAAQLPGPAITSAFLKSFGKPDRLLTCECERSESTTLAQAFQMINGETLRRKLESSSNRISHRLTAGVSDVDLMNEFYLAALTRMPTAVEAAAVLAHLGRASDRRKAWEDVVWALLNSKEFLLRH
jgi:Protein of unknown function (DUF1549)/Protein of unknown function (DUF1553)